MKLSIFGPLAITAVSGIISRCLILAVALSASSAAAQTMTTYWYTGNPFNVSECLAIFGQTLDTCPTGRITATVTFTNLPSGYTGTAGTGNLFPFTFSTSALGLNINNNTPDLVQTCQTINGPCGVFVNFLNGSIMSWSVQLLIPTGAFNEPYNGITTIGIPCNLTGRSVTHCGEDFAINLLNDNAGLAGFTALEGFSGPADPPGVWSTTQPTCSDIVTGAMPPPVLSGQSTTGEPTMVSATFTPNYGMTLQQAADACNVKSFNWIQQVTVPAPSPFWASNLPILGGIPVIPTNVTGMSYDPPPLGGWTYEYWSPGAYHLEGDFAYPFYCNDPGSFLPGNRCAKTVNTLAYSDDPHDVCLPNPDGTPSTAWTSGSIPNQSGILTPVKSFCGDTWVKPPAKPFVNVFFQLVGVSPSFVPGTDCLSLKTCVSFGGYFDEYGYVSTFNGTSGGDVGLAEEPPVDPGSGSGGITLLQLPTAVPPTDVATTASGLAYSRVSQTFNGTVTLTNITDNTISGPLQILFTAMPSNVTLVNATGSFAGIPYLTVPAAAGLAPGQSVTVGTQFKNPSNATMNFAPAIYSGSIS